MIVVIGLGNMGAAVAERLVASGHDVAAVDLDAASRNAWSAKTGVSAYADLQELDWKRAERAVIVVRLTSQAETVLQQLAMLAAPQQLSVYLMTTLDIDFARSLSERDNGSLRVLETPVSGGDAIARAGQLTVMMAGSATEDDVAFLTDTLASHLERFERHGDPTLVKLLNNVTASYNARTLAEMLLIAKTHGLDPRSLQRILATSSGGSWVTSRFGDLLHDLLVKDAGLLETLVGQLPSMTVSDHKLFTQRLSRARELLRDEAPVAAP